MRDAILPVVSDDDRLLPVLHAAVRPTAADRGLLSLDDFAELFDLPTLDRAGAVFLAGVLVYFAKAEDLAEAIAFLVSPRASYITGVSLNLDGGRLKGLW